VEVVPVLVVPVEVDHVLVVHVFVVPVEVLQVFVAVTKLPTSKASSALLAPLELECCPANNAVPSFPQIATTAATHPG
jgi:hypothetical protein